MSQGKVTVTAIVRRVELDARNLITIGALHPLWMQARGQAIGEEVVAEIARCVFTGAIVRVQPPADASDEEIAKVKELLEKGGAAVVRGDKRARGDALPEVDLFAAPALHRNLREVVMRHADASPRAAELRALLDQELAKAGQ